MLSYTQTMVSFLHAWLSSNCWTKGRCNRTVSKQLTGSDGDRPRSVFGFSTTLTESVISSGSLISIPPTSFIYLNTLLSISQFSVIQAIGNAEKWVFNHLCYTLFLFLLWLPLLCKLIRSVSPHHKKHINWHANHYLMLCWMCTYTPFCTRHLPGIQQIIFVPVLHAWN